MSDFYTENNQWAIKSSKCQRVLIFGAKENAERIYKSWMREPKIDGFLVSKRRDNPYVLADKPVYTFDDIPLKERGLYLLVISQKYDNIDAMKKLLDEIGFCNHVAMNQSASYESYQNKACLWCKGLEKLSESESKVDRELIKRKLCIYAVTSHKDLHKGKLEIDKNFITLIQVGAALTDVELSEVKDNSGKNLSKENPQLCEMSAAYWIANNDKEHDYVGLCQYARGFDISYGQAMEILEENYDMIIPSPIIFYEQMISYTHLEMYKAIEKVSPEDLVFAQKYILGSAFCLGNLMIAKRAVYKEYIDWVFKILDGVKVIHEEEGIDMLPRKQAYIAEHLTNIFILKNFERFKIGSLNIIENI